MKEGKGLSADKKSKDGEPPFYLSDEEFESLRLVLQTVSPEKQKIYQELQQKACGEFVSQWRDFLNERQIAYMVAPNVIIADSDKLSDLRKIWSENIDQTSEKTLLNGKQYLEYRILEPEFRQKEGEKSEKAMAWADTAAQLWAGRVAVVPLLREYENASISSSLLISEAEYENLYEWDFVKMFDSSSYFIATSTWAEMALHEKIHGIQRYDLPFPFLEIIRPVAF